MAATGSSTASAVGRSRSRSRSPPSARRPQAGRLTRSSSATLTIAVAWGGRDDERRPGPRRGLGHLGEALDGDDPSAPAGSILSATSASALLLPSLVRITASSQRPQALPGVGETSSFASWPTGSGQEMSAARDVVAGAHGGDEPVCLVQRLGFLSAGVRTGRRRRLCRRRLVRRDHGRQAAGQAAPVDEHVLVLSLRLEVGHDPDPRAADRPDAGLGELLDRVGRGFERRVGQVDGHAQEAAADGRLDLLPRSPIGRVELDHEVVRRRSGDSRRPGRTCRSPPPGRAAGGRRRSPRRRAGREVAAGPRRHRRPDEAGEHAAAARCLRARLDGVEGRVARTGPGEAVRIVAALDAVQPRSKGPAAEACFPASSAPAMPQARRRHPRAARRRGARRRLPAAQPGGPDRHVRPGRAAVPVRRRTTS